MRIADRKTSLVAETSALYRKRPLIVTICPHEAILREKGRPGRSASYSVPWLAVYDLAMKLDARERQRRAV